MDLDLYLQPEEKNSSDEQKSTHSWQELDLWLKQYFPKPVYFERNSQTAQQLSNYKQKLDQLQKYKELVYIPKVLSEEYRFLNRKYEAIMDFQLDKENLQYLDIFAKLFQLFQISDMKDTSPLLYRILLEKKSNIETGLELLEVETKIESMRSKISTCRNTTKMIREKMKDFPWLKQKQKNEEYLKNAQLLQQKKIDYQQKIINLQQELKLSGYNNDLKYSSLKEYWLKVQDEQAKLNEKKKHIEAYHDLPPDLILAKIKMAEKKRELTHLHHEKRKILNSIGQIGIF